MNTFLFVGAGMNRFEIILWDLDGTLLDFPKSESYAISYCFAKFGLVISEEIIHSYAAINDRFWKRLERGEINRDVVLLGRFEELFRTFGIGNVDAGEFQSEYREALGSVYYFLDEADTFCKHLSKEYRQYIVTNGIAYTQTKKLKLSGLDKIMDGIFISEEIGYPKPMKEFFTACTGKIPRYQQEKTIIVGDSLTSDMLGGNHAGIATCWYNPNGLQNNTDVTIDYEIKKLQELEAILGG